MIERIDWHGMSALQLEDADLRFVCLPELGGKIASILDKHRGREWVVGPDSRPLRRLNQGAVWTDEDMSGWDEMFPTINPCSYPGPGANTGKPLPDHGEVWTRSWEVLAEDNREIALQVEGVALPYRLTRTAGLTGGVLSLDYRVHNTGSDHLRYLWAAHPQFNCGEDSRIVLPAGVKEVLLVYDPERGWDSEGSRVPWPGESLDKVAPVSRKTCRKLYLPPDQRIAWAEVIEQTTGDWLRLEWEPHELPYLGIWVDEGCFNSVHTVALEPTCAFFDDLASADRKGLAAVLAPAAARVWSLKVRVGTREPSAFP